MDTASRLLRLCAAVALIAVAGCDVLTNPNGPSASPNTIHYTAIGASDAIGFGGTSPCLPLVACTTGTGYVQQVTRRLTAAGKSVTLVNLGIPGAVLSPDIQALATSIGRDVPANFIEREGPFVTRTTTLVTIFAGGNDVNIVGSALRAGRGGADIGGYITAQVAAFGADLRRLVGIVRGRASDARIVALNLPNMAAMPYANGYSVEERRWMQQLAVGFSAETNRLTADNVVVIDLMCDDAFYGGGLLSSDGFHPNDAGYTHLADLVEAAVTASSWPAPRASCAPMAAF